VIGAGETKVVKLGVKLDLEMLETIAMKEANYFYNYSDGEIKAMTHDFLKSHYLEVALRSSLGVKGLIIANGTGKVDLDYPDEIGLIVHNPVTEHTITWWIDRIAKMCGLNTNFNKNNNANFLIKKGSKVAQCTLIHHKCYLMGYESDVVRDGGFGSTGA
jgi:dUTPase